MKTLLVAVFLLIGISSQSFSMGHPHNLFAARKQMRAKSSATINKEKVDQAFCGTTVKKTAKTIVSNLIAGVCYQLRPTQSAN